MTPHAVTTLGSNVDGAVRPIETAYDTAGRAYLFTSYNSAGSVVNQILDQFNGYGQLAAEYEDHGAAVNTSTTPKVQYAYTTPDATHDYSRPTTMTYPNGRVVRYLYDDTGAGIDSAISRLSSIADGASGPVVLEAYAYLGLGTIVEKAQPEAKIKLTYVRQAGDAAASSDGGDRYTGLDRFGRVIDQNWLRTAASAGGAAAGTSTVRQQYGYDRDGDALSRRDLVFQALSELYQYDGLGRLASYKRGVLTASSAGGPYDTIASPLAQQFWGLDAQGNWGSFTNFDGTTTTTTTKGFDEGNQTTTVNGSAPAAPTYDSDGNTKTKDGRSYVYDAWNRLVAVKNSIGATLASYAYDALRRRIKETAGTATTDVYFTPGAQVVEERAGWTAAANVSYQYVLGADGQMMFRDSYTGGAVVAASRLYAQQDANGDVVALVGGATATAGDAQERYWYEPYGAVHALAGNGARPAGSAYVWKALFQGGRLDAATGLYAFGLRDYDPSAGVWMERDPIGQGGGDPNLYRFVGSNPISWTDPTGLDGWSSAVDAAQVGGAFAGGFVMGTTQGAANTLNAVTDAGITTVNILPGAWNYTFGLLPGAPKASYLPTPDWSNNKFTTESPGERALSRGAGAIAVGAGSLLLGGPGISSGATTAGKGLAGIAVMADGTLAVAPGATAAVVRGGVTAAAAAGLAGGSAAAAGRSSGSMFCSADSGPANGNAGAPGGGGPTPGAPNNPPWKLGSNHSPKQWANKMGKRGWTNQQIDEAMAGGQNFPAPNQVNPTNGATRYVHPETGRSVVLDDVTGEVIHVGGDGYLY